MSMRAILLAMANFTVAASPTVADPGQQLAVEEIRVYGSRLEPDPIFVDADSVVLTRDDIAKQHPLDTVELLRRLPGVFIARQGAPGGVASLYTRGGEPNFTSVFINGVQVNNPTDSRGGSFDFSTLDPGLIQRIELVRGPRSAVYGSDALAGALNIVTRRREEQSHSELAAGAGERGQRSLGYRLSVPLGDHGGANVAYRDEDHGELVEGYTLDRSSLMGSFSGRWSGLSWGLDMIRSESSRTAYPEDSGGPELAALDLLDEADADERMVSGRAEFELSQRWQVSLLGGWQERDETFDSPGIAMTYVPPNGERSSFRRRSVVVNNQFSLPLEVDLAAGLDFRAEHGKSAGYVEFSGGRIPTAFDRKTDTIAAFAELRRRLGPLSVSAGLRHDDPDGFDSRRTLRLGAVVRFPDQNGQLSMNWGEGFKLPSMFALGNSLVGNPELQPERSRGFSITAQRDFGNATASVTGHHTRYRNLVDFDPDRFININRSAVLVRGAELGLSWPLTSYATLSSDLNYINTSLSEGPGRLRGRPEWLGRLSLAWQVQPNVEVVFTGRWVDEVLQHSLVTGFVELDSYAVADVNIRWKASERLAVDLSFDNVGDATYQEAVGVPAPRRQLRGRITYRFEH